MIRQKELVSLFGSIHELEGANNSTINVKKINKAYIKEKVSDFYKRLKSSKEKILFIISNVYNIAFLISSFDLKLNHYSEKIIDAGSKIKITSSDIYSSSESILKSISEISEANNKLIKSVENIKSKADIFKKNYAENHRMIKQISDNSTVIIKHTDDMKAHFESLQSSFEKMKEIIAGIYEISDQTNMLAFNASIEAARAGEAGKSFSVVAEEIRKLSDTTKNLLSSINEIFNSIYENSKNSSESVNSTVNLVKDITNSINTILDYTEANNSAITDMSADLGNILRSSEEIKLSMDETGSSINNLNYMSNNLNSYSEVLELTENSIKNLSQEIEAIENSINSAAQKCGEVLADRIFSVSNDRFIEFINIVISKHKDWVNELGKMVNDMTVKPLQTDEHKCSFGHFYYTIYPSNPEIQDIWKQIGYYHSQVHQTGGNTIEFIGNNDKEKAQESFEEVLKASGMTIDLMEQLIKKVETLAENNETVF